VATPGGVCLLGGQALVKLADRLAVDARDPGDLALSDALRQQRAQRRL